MSRAAGPPERRQEPILALLLLVGAIIAVGVVVADPGQPAVILLVWVPVAGAALLEPRRVALLGVVTLVVGVAVILSADMFDTTDRTTRMLALVGSGVGAVWLAAIRAAREDSLRRMTHVAQVAQRAIIRAVPHTVGNLGLACRYLSASEEALIGGDLFEAVLTPHGVRIVVGDVRGKGLPAVEVASTVLSTFRVAAVQEADLADLAARLDEAVRAEIARGDEEDFVTALLVQVQEDGSSTVVSCGHHPPLLLDDPPRPVAVEENPPLGLGPGRHHARTWWPPGTRVLLYTDGLVEARDLTGRFFPLEAHVPALREGDLEESLDVLVARLLAHAGGTLADDLALLLLECRAAPAPVPVQEQQVTRQDAGARPGAGDP